MITALIVAKPAQLKVSEPLFQEIITFSLQYPISKAKSPRGEDITILSLSAYLLPLFAPYSPISYNELYIKV